MLTGIAHDLRRRIEAHRLTVQKGSSESSLVMTFEPGRHIGQQGKARYLAEDDRARRTDAGEPVGKLQ